MAEGRIGELPAWLAAGAQARASSSAATGLRGAAGATAGRRARAGEGEEAGAADATVQRQALASSERGGGATTESRDASFLDSSEVSDASRLGDASRASDGGGGGSGSGAASAVGFSAGIGGATATVRESGVTTLRAYLRSSSSPSSSPGVARARRPLPEAAWATRMRSAAMAAC